MSNKDEQGGTDVTQKNVFSKPLHQHSNPKASSNPSDSTLKSGFCSSSSPIAAILTQSFLETSGIKGTEVGSRFCMPTTSWQRALSSSKDKDDVPKVKLECTHESALQHIKLEELEKYKAGQDHGTGVQWAPDNQTGTGGAGIKQSGEIGGREPKA